MGLGIAQYGGAELTVLSVIEPLLAQAAGIRLGVDFARVGAEPALREFAGQLTEEEVQALIVYLKSSSAWVQVQGR